MNKLILLFPCLLIIFSSFGQAPTIQVSGSNIKGVCNDNIILRGINYSPYNWGWSPGTLEFSEIAKTNSNCVRIVWYTSDAIANDNNSGVYDNLTNLDAVIGDCINNKMIPILELHDIPCTSEVSQLSSLSNWYMSNGVKTIISKYSHNLIINIANEVGDVEWSSNPTSSLAAFKSGYESFITGMRNAGINVPLMIDSPDCGTSLTDLASIGPDMETADPKHNLIFSTHGYWTIDPTTMVNNALLQNIPIVLGEAANYGGNGCGFTVNYQQILNLCQTNNIGWLAWSWDNDICSARQISSDGKFTNLTSFGNDIVNNAAYGLKQHSVLSNYLANKQSCSSDVSVGPISNSNIITANAYTNGKTLFAEYNNPSNSKATLVLYNLQGQKLFSKELNKGNYNYQLNLPEGLYIAMITGSEFIYRNKVYLK